jgi:hypothetical protein
MFVLICWLLCGAGGKAEDVKLPSLWNEYRTIMWIGDSAYRKPEKFPLFLSRLREMGINTAMVFGDGDPRPLVEARFPYHVENIVNKGLCLKWNSKVRDWDGFVTAWAKGGRPDSALVRDYCLDDPQWREWACGEMQRVARKNMPNGPLAYNIRDELSTTISANPFDYDFNPITLQKFREWLKTQYRDLDALNAEWDTRFATWEEVKPFTTDQIKNRMASGDAIPRGKPDWQALEKLKFDPVEARKNPARWNFSPWCDFRTYMDNSLAGALGEIRAAARKVDPNTPVGIEGMQAASAFGGYDLYRLSRELDWAEPYDIGNAREILGSFMRGKPMLTTVGEADANHARRRLWHLLLEGDRGCIVWWSEDCIDWKSDDYKLTPRGAALAPVLREMRSPLARVLLRATRVYDPIAICYSQPGIQVDWLLESTVDGSTWLRRFSSYESEHNRMMKARDAWLKALEDDGYSPQFVSSEEIESGLLEPGRFAALVMSEALATSDAMDEKVWWPPLGFSSVIGPWTRRTVFSEGIPGLFDEHGKLREGALGKSPPGGAPLSGVCATVETGKALVFPGGDIAGYPAARLSAQPDLSFAKWIAGAMPQLKPEITVPVESRTRIYRYRLGNSQARVVAFERNIDYQMSEDLKQRGGNESLEKPVELDAKLDKPAYVYDLRAQKYVGFSDRIHFTLDPWEPSIFVLWTNKIPAEQLMEALFREPVSGTDSRSPH